MKMHLNKPTGLKYSELVHSVPDNEFKNLTRSTVPSLAYWKSPQRRDELMNIILGENNYGNADLCFEYSVPSYGSNRPSYTDLMLISPNGVVAIEVKHTEPRYESVTHWLGENPTQNKQNVLSHWLSILQPHCEHLLTPDNVGDIPYQMLHRVASGCYVGDEHRQSITILYQVFDGENSHYADYVEDLASFRVALQLNPEVKLAITRIDTELSAAGEALSIELDDMDELHRAHAIRLTLINNDIYVLGEDEVVYF